MPQNCEFKYRRETGRKFNTRLSEHQKDAKNIPQIYTRSEQTSSETRFNKSALTDHIAKVADIGDSDKSKDQSVFTCQEPGGVGGGSMRRGQGHTT